MDGSSNQHGYGAGLVLQITLGEQMKYTIHIGFKATNNEVEYEALLARLRVVAELGVESLDQCFENRTVERTKKETGPLIIGSTVRSTVIDL